MITGGGNSRSKAFIMNDYKRITKNCVNDGFSVGLINNNIHTWEIVIIGPKDTPYESGIYRAEMVFPLYYPEAPPRFKFITPMWHPNIDKEGNVCISILHKPGEDEFEYEDPSERWLPVRTPESVILSVTAMLDSPNLESSFNLEAAMQYRSDQAAYRRKVMEYAQKSLEMA